MWSECFELFLKTQSRLVVRWLGEEGATEENVYSKNGIEGKRRFNRNEWTDTVGITRAAAATRRRDERPKLAADGHTPRTTLCIDFVCSVWGGGQSGRGRDTGGSGANTEGRAKSRGLSAYRRLRTCLGIPAPSTDTEKGEKRLAEFRVFSWRCTTF